MKKMFKSGLSLLFVLVFCTTQGFSLTGKSLLKKMIEAQGGRKNISNVSDSVVKGKVELLAAGLKGSVMISRIEPNLHRVDINLDGLKITQAFDGKTAWIIHPKISSKPTEMPENFAKQFKRQVLGYNTLLYPKKYGITYKFKGREKLKDKDCLVLEGIRADDSRVYYYLDPKTYLVVKFRTKSLNQLGAEVDAENHYSDYRKVEGLMLAFETLTFLEGKEYLKFSITGVNYNSGVNAELFKMSK